MKTHKAFYFWILLIVFAGGLWFLQAMLKQSGSALIPGNGGEFTLTSVSGDVSLSDFKGKVVMMYFGYMSCPDVCPTALLIMGSSMDMLSQQQAEQVQGIFISLDPDRDSPLAISQYASGFNESFIGLTDRKSVIDQVARLYKVVYKKTPLKNSSIGYVVDHTSVTYLIDQYGVLQYSLPHNSSAEKVTESIRSLLN